MLVCIGIDLSGLIISYLLKIVFYFLLFVCKLILDQWKVGQHFALFRTLFFIILLLRLGDDKLHDNGIAVLLFVCVCVCVDSPTRVIQEADMVTGL